MASARLIIFENRLKKDGTTAIMAQVHISNKSIRINTGVFVAPLHFDKKKARVKGNSKAVKEDNLILDSCLARITDIIKRYQLQHKPLTADLLLREYKNPSLYIDFYKFYDQRLKDRLRGREISPVSEKHQRVTLNKLTEFKAALNFAEIDRKFIQSFKRFLRVEKGNSVNTIQKTMAYFNIYLNIARNEEIITINPLEFIENRRTKTSRVFLSESELKKLIGFYDRGEYSDHLHTVLRHYLFMCLTGVRISDFKRLRVDHVRENCLKFIPHKTRAKKQTELTVPLLEKARQLIKEENNTLGRELFFTFSDQEYNRRLKDISELGGINKEITNHSARHTFATLFLEKTNDVATLQKILGHSNIKETMVYVHIGTQKISDQMNNFDCLLDIKKTRKK